MKRVWWVGAVVAVLGVLLPHVASAALLQLSPQPDPEPRFVTQCGFSHRAPDDPIVRPGQPAASHSHDFVGNVSTDAYSTYESLRDAGTSCSLSADASGYWMPTLSRFGTPVAPVRFNAYYLAGSKDATTIRAFPAGLKAVAGNSKAEYAQSTTVVFWGCSGRRNIVESTPPDCPDDSRLELHVAFPDCWNGADLDSPDHASHLAYARGGECDPDHPVPLPRLVLGAMYPMRDGQGVSLSSGGVLTGHADFFNAWEQSKLEGLVSRCVNAERHCAVQRDPD
jgi:hypothetical protein